MNLVDDPWIPVIGTDGSSRLTSLEDIFKTGDDIADLAANPCQRIALMRLFICIAQAALDGPADEDDWRACRPRLAPAALDYLAKWRTRFNLFGEHAFLQVDGLETLSSNGAAKPVDKLDCALAVGNAHTLFDAEARASGSRRTSGSLADLAMNLLVVQSFGLGGGVSPNVTWNGVAVDGSENPKENGKVNNNFTAGALANRRAYTFLRAQTLLESIHLNLMTKQDVAMYMPTSQWGGPLWAEFPVAYHGSNVDELRSGYLQNLVPLSRFVKLLQGEPVMMSPFTNGYAYPNDVSVYREPTASVCRDRDDNLQFLGLFSGKSPWRDLGAILELNNKSGALCVKRFHDLRGADGDACLDVWVGGLISDQAKVIDMVEWHAPFAPNWLSSQQISFYRNGVGQADRADRRLRKSIATYHETCGNQLFKRRDNGRYAHADKRSQKVRDTVEAQACTAFWTSLDSDAATLMRLSKEHDRQGEECWHGLIRSAMHTAYSQTCPHETPRQIQAYAQGLKMLEKWKGEAQNE